MAVVRLIAHAGLALAAAAACAACRASEAAATSGLTPPEGWRPLPELVNAATAAAKAAELSVDGVEAWGEPARGCYAAWLAIQGSAGAPSAIAKAMLANLPVDLPGIAVTDIVEPAGNADAGVLSLSFTRAPYRGRVRAPIAKTGAIHVLACYWSLREPIACEAACNQLLGSMK